MNRQRAMHLVASLDLDGTVLEVHGATGLPDSTDPSSLVGKPLTAILGITRCTNIPEMVRKTIEAQQGAVDRFRSTDTSDGRRIEISTSPCRNPNRTDRCTVVVTSSRTTDDLISDLRLESPLHAALNGSDLIVVLVGLDMTLLHINEGGARLLGVHAEDIIGADWVERFIPATERASLQRYATRLAEGSNRSFQHENHLISADGTEYLIQWTNEIVRDDSGNVVGLFAIGQDITAREKNERSLHESTSHLSTLYALSQVIADSNDLEELPLRAIECLLEHTDFETATVRLISSDRSTVRMVAQAGFPSHFDAASLKLPTERVRKWDVAQPRCAAYSVDDTQGIWNDYRETLGTLRQIGMRKGVAVILADGNELIGLIAMNTPKDREISPSELKMLETCGAQIGVAVSRLRLRLTERENHADTELLARVMYRLSALRELEDILQGISEELQNRFPNVGVLFYQADDVSDRLSIVAAAVNDPELMSYVRAESPIPTSLRSGDLPERQLLVDRPPWMYSAANPTCVIMPLREGNTLIGALEMVFETGFALDTRHKKFLQRLTEMVVSEVQKARFHSDLASLNQFLAASNLQRSVQLEEERDRMTAVIESVRDAILVTDLDRRVIMANTASRRIFAFASAGEGHITLDEILGASRAQEVLPSNEWETSGETDVEFAITGPNAREIALSARTAAVQGRTGRTVGFVTLFRDMTRHYENDRIKSAFLATAAHELRTPVTTLRGFSEILLNRDIPDAERTRFLQYVHKQSVALSDLVANLVDVSRFESGGEIALDIEDCDISDIVTTAVQEARRSTTRHRITADFDGPIPPVRGDRPRLQQVVRNILSNATKFSPEGGDISVRCCQDGRWVRVAVTDHGIGMTEEQQSAVFDDFFRVDTSNTAPEGTGLGLSLVYRIVRMHDGIVWIESAPGIGTTATFALPTIDAKPLALVWAGTASTNRGLATALEVEGWDGVFVSSPRQFLQTAMESLPTVAVILESAEHDSTVLSTVASDDRTRHLPIVILDTPMAEPGIRKALGRHPCDLVSPATSDQEIVKRIEAARPQRTRLSSRDAARRVDAGTH